MKNIFKNYTSQIDLFKEGFSIIYQAMIESLEIAWCELTKKPIPIYEYESHEVQEKEIKIQETLQSQETQQEEHPEDLADKIEVSVISTEVEYEIPNIEQTQLPSEELMFQEPPITEYEEHDESFDIPESSQEYLLPDPEFAQYLRKDQKLIFLDMASVQKELGVEDEM